MEELCFKNALLKGIVKVICLFSYLLGRVKILILNGNSKQVAHVRRKKVLNNFKFETIVDLTNALNRSSYRFISRRAHLFLNYHLISIIGRVTFFVQSLKRSKYLIKRLKCRKNSKYLLKRVDRNMNKLIVKRKEEWEKIEL